MPKIAGYRVQSYTDEFPSTGRVKLNIGVEFGNSPVRDRQALLRHLEECVDAGIIFTVEPIEVNHATN